MYLTPIYDSKMTNHIHVLMWDTNDVNAVLSHGIENQISSRSVRAKALIE